MHHEKIANLFIIMKNMEAKWGKNNKILAGVLLATIASSSMFTSVSADNENIEAWNSQVKEFYKIKGEGWKWKMKGYMKDELQQYFDTLSDEQKQALDDIKEKYKSEFDALKINIDKNEWTQEQRDEFHESMKALHDSQHAEIMSIIWEESELAQKLEEIKQKREEMKAQIEENRVKMKGIRTEFQEKRLKMRDGFKIGYLEKLGENISNIPADRLEKLSEKLDTMYTQTQESTNLEDEKKQELLWKIEALQEIISDSLWE